MSENKRTMAERIYLLRVREQNDELVALRATNADLLAALAPFVTDNAGLHFDLRPDGAVVIGCRYCDAWAGKLINKFPHDSACRITKGRAAIARAKEGT